MKKLQSVESLRAYMAWWVVIGHALHLIGVGSSADLPGGLAFLPDRLVDVLLRGDIAVYVFVIVSGFVITHLLIARREPYRAYIGRRFIRLFPVYAVCLVAAIMLGPFYAAAYIDSGLSFAADMRLDRLAEESTHLPAHLILHTTLLHGAIPDTVLPFAGSAFLAPAWSLSLEWQFYLIAPVLVLCLAGRGTNCLLATIVSLVLIRVVLRQQSVLDWQYDSFFFLASSYFLIGILCRVAMERLSQSRSHIEYLLLAAILMLTVEPLAAFVWLVWFGIILIESGQMSLASRPVTKAVTLIAFNRWAPVLGRWSYATYLVHIPIFSLIIGGYVLIVGPSAVRTDIAAALLAASFPVVAWASALLHLHVEVPSIRIGRKWFSTTTKSHSRFQPS